MDVFEAAFLGTVQGLTEFLPVSSSGHIVILEHWLGVKQTHSMFFEILLHIGTLLAIVYIYRETLFNLLNYTFVDCWGQIKHNGMKGAFAENPDGRFVSLVLVGSLATAVVVGVFKEFFVGMFDKPVWVSTMLIVTGIILLASLLGRERKSGILGITFVDAALIGLFQGFAVTPGISRSGITIVVALLLGIDRKTSATFSFILVIPVTLGAMTYDFLKSSELLGFDFSTIIAGLLFSFVSGLFALKVLIKFVRKGKLHYFTGYCIVVGAIGVVCFI